MRTFDDQKKRYEECWNQHRSEIGNAFMKKDEESLFCIGFWLTAELDTTMAAESTRLASSLDPKQRHCWVTPDQMHVTLSLPGRLGKQFNADDIPIMVRQLAEIAKETSPFSVTIGDVNCFPEVLIREIYNDDGALFQLHNRIADKIPWSETPQYTRGNFTPHLSLCYLREAHPHFLPEEFRRSAEPLQMKVQSLYFVRSFDIVETITIAELEFGTGAISKS